jgi:hypothetical protein
MKIFSRISAALLFYQKFFGGSQTLARIFQIIIPVAKFNEQFCQCNQMLDLKTQWPSAPTAHFIQFRPLFFRHADIELLRFFRHTRIVPDIFFEFMVFCDLQRVAILSKSPMLPFPKNCKKFLDDN